MNDARLDLKRRQRLGMVEAVWGEHKTVQQITAILERFAASGELGLVTRVSADKADAVAQVLPAVVIHAEARCLTYGDLPPAPAGPPAVAVLSGGSSDRTVVAEAALVNALQQVESDHHCVELERLGQDCNGLTA